MKRDSCPYYVVMGQIAYIAYQYSTLGGARYDDFASNFFFFVYFSLLHWKSTTRGCRKQNCPLPPLLQSKWKIPMLPISCVRRYRYCVCLENFALHWILWTIISANRLPITSNCSLQLYVPYSTRKTTIFTANSNNSWLFSTINADNAHSAYCNNLYLNYTHDFNDRLLNVRTHWAKGEKEREITQWTYGHVDD